MHSADTRTSAWTAKETQWVAPVWMATDAILDLALVVFMSMSLFSQRTGFRK